MSTNDIQEVRSLFNVAEIASARDEINEALGRIFNPRRAFHASSERLNLALDGSTQTSLADVVHEVSMKIIPRSIHYRHKWAMAHMVPPPAVIAIIGDLFVSALNQCAFIWEEAPVAAELEKEVLRWMATKLKLAPRSQGLFTTGGTVSNYLAMMLAKQQSDRYRPDPRRLCVVASDQSHFSIQRAIRIVGLPDTALIRVATNQEGRLSPGQILETTTRLLRVGKAPVLFVCTAGTSNAGVMEDASEFLAASQRCHAWCHVDAANGGATCFRNGSRDFACRWALADSVSWDPHKSLYVPYSLGALFVRCPRSLDILRVTSEYALKPDTTHVNNNVGTKHFYTSRRLDALKLWMTIRQFGDAGFEAITAHCFNLAASFAKLINEATDFELHTYPDTNIVCFRFLSPGCGERELNELNSSIQAKLFAVGGPLFSSTRVNGVTYLRAVLLNPFVEVSDLQFALNELRDIAADIVDSMLIGSSNESTPCYKSAS
jgi:L-2,4-diaminobutyrate decarboxylase